MSDDRATPNPATLVPPERDQQSLDDIVDPRALRIVTGLIKLPAAFFSFIGGVGTGLILIEWQRLPDGHHLLCTSLPMLSLGIALYIGAWFLNTDLGHAE